MSNSEDDEFWVSELDFTQFHDLMHVPFTPYCWRLFGGPRRHVAIWWEYVAVGELRRRTLCRLGRHRPATWGRTGSTETFQGCTDCVKRLSPASDTGD